MSTLTKELASDRLLWAVRCATKVDYRGKGLSTEQAQQLIVEANAVSGYTPKAKAAPAPAKAPATLGTQWLKNAPKVKGKTTNGLTVIVDGVKLPAKVLLEARQFMTDSENVKKLFTALFGATAVVEGLTNDITGKNTGFVLVGGGCGFGIVDGYRKTAKNKAIMELAGGFKEELNTLVRAMLPAATTARLMALGNPVRAMQAQCETYNACFAGIVAEFMNLQGIAGAYGTSRAD